MSISPSVHVSSKPTPVSGPLALAGGWHGQHQPGTTAELEDLPGIGPALQLASWPTVRRMAPLHARGSHSGIVYWEMPSMPTSRTAS